MDPLDPFDIALRALVTLFACVMVLLAVLAYRRVGGARLFLSLTVFVVFLVKGLILTFVWLVKAYNPLVTNVLFHTTFDLVILLLLFFGLMRASPRKKPVIPPEEQSG